MAQYINKGVLATEIERLKSIQLSIFSKGETDESCYNALSCISVYNEVLSFLDTLEVKDVDLEKELNDYGYHYDYVSLASRKELVDFARHFFELGLKAQKGE